MRTLAGARTTALDCLIIGGGPAGLLAAIYLGRYRRNIQIIDAGESRAAKSPQSLNYPGFFGISGRDLLGRLRVQAQEYGVQLTSGLVTSLHREGGDFVAFCSKQRVRARFVLLATGLVDVVRTSRAKLVAPQRPSDSAPSATAMK
jgi:thioredoxin reductase (NADPH)